MSIDAKKLDRIINKADNALEAMERLHECTQLGMSRRAVNNAFDAFEFLRDLRRERQGDQ